MYLEFGKAKAGSTPRASAADTPSEPSTPAPSTAEANAVEAADVAMMCPADEAEEVIEREEDPLLAEACAKAAKQMDHVFIFTHERDMEQALAKNVPAAKFTNLYRTCVSHHARIFCSWPDALAETQITTQVRGPGAAQGWICHRLPDFEDEGESEVH